MSDEDIDIVSVPKAIFEKKYISRDAYDALRAELARVTAERDALKAKLSRRDTWLDEALNSGDGTYRP